MPSFRVVDLSRLLPGPFTTLCLQGLGAGVVKVEDPAGGDALRHVPPRIGEHGAWFAALNRGKRSVALDLKSPAGRTAALRLIATADVLVESFRPGVMARLGLDPAALRRAHPRLVIASITGWGQSGPYAALPGHDINFLGLAGVFGGRAPGLPSVQWADISAGGVAAALRIVAALWERDRTGEGAWLDIAMLDGLIAMQQTRFAGVAAGVQEHQEPPDLLSGGTPLYGVYACRDGWVSVASLEPPFLARLAAAIPDWDTPGAIAAYCAAHTRSALAAALGEACVLPILAPEEVAAHPHVAARGLFGADGLAHPPTGRVEGPPPRLGEHTESELAAC